MLAPGGVLVFTCWRTISPLFQAVADSPRTHVSEKSAKQALGPYALRDRDVIESCLSEAGLEIAKASSILVNRHLSPLRPAIREEILASPYEQALLDKGEQTIDSTVGEAAAALERYRDGEGLVVPQEAHLFQCRKAAAA